MRRNSFMTGCVVLMGLTVVALIPSTAGSATIYQCAQKVTGLLRVVSAPSDCLPSEKSIVLSIPVIVHGSVIDLQVVTNGAVGFTFEKVQTGQYVVTFDSAFASAPDCQVTTLNPPVNLVGICTTITGATTTAVGVACRLFLNDGSTTLFDQNFTLMCVL